jgi:hypothetical protein
LSIENEICEILYIHWSADICGMRDKCFTATKRQERERKNLKKE